jgi:hypothetical protein
MRSTLNNACISALLCGAVLIAIPAVAAGADDTANGNIGAAASTSPASTSTSGDINTTTADKNAGSVNSAAQTPAHHMFRKAQANANAAEIETTRQLNQQQAAAGANGAAGTTVQ